jgi:hypothetical protein
MKRRIVIHHNRFIVIFHTKSIFHNVSRLFFSEYYSVFWVFWLLKEKREDNNNLKLQINHYGMRLP